MKYQYCKIDRTKMNRLYYTEVRKNEGKKRGAIVKTNYFWCKTCKTLCEVNSELDTVKIPLVRTN